MASNFVKLGSLKVMDLRSELEKRKRNEWHKTSLKKSVKVDIIREWKRCRDNFFQGAIDFSTSFRNVTTND